MADPQKIWKEELEIVRNQIGQEQSELGITDSGRSKLSMNISNRGNKFELSAVGYLRTNFDGVGRGPGAPPPFQDIMRWGKLDPRPGQTIRQAAFLVANKIGQQCTDIFTGERRGIDMDQITKDSADRLGKELADNELIRFNDIFE